MESTSVAFDRAWIERVARAPVHWRRASGLFYVLLFALIAFIALATSMNRSIDSRGAMLGLWLGGIGLLLVACIGFAAASAVAIIAPFPAESSPTLARARNTCRASGLIALALPFADRLMLGSLLPDGWTRDAFSAAWWLALCIFLGSFVRLTADLSQRLIQDAQRSAALKRSARHAGIACGVCLACAVATVINVIVSMILGANPVSAFVPLIAAVAGGLGAIVVWLYLGVLMRGVRDGALLAESLPSTQ